MLVSPFLELILIYALFQFYVIVVLKFCYANNDDQQSYSA